MLQCDYLFSIAVIIVLAKLINTMEYNINKTLTNYNKNQIR